jgi:peptidoglycan/LPS O-acetylase OafA/YrhL
VASGTQPLEGDVGKTHVDVTRFWIRRGVRIGVPLIAVILAARAAGPDYVVALDKILWSVYAELIYYALYPLLLPYMTRFGIGRFLAVSFALSAALLLSSPKEVYLWGFGVELTWLFCAPLWLLGCYLAEHRSLVSKISRRVSVWTFRIGAVAYCYLSTILATHLGNLIIGYTYTIILFGVLCVFWLDAEMANGTGKSPVRLLERFGLAGYSLYLTHRFALTFMSDYQIKFAPAAAWIITLAAILTLTWVFYRLVEWPSHLLARSLGRR